MKYLTGRIVKAPTDADATFELVAYDPHSDDVDDIKLAPEYVATAVPNFTRRKRNLALRWQHDLRDPDSAIGVIDKVWVDAVERLMVSGHFDLTNDFAVKVWEGVLAGRINEASISWDTLPDGTMELLEVSIVSIGANRGTQVACAGAACGGGKSLCGCGDADERAAKAGRTISAGNEAKLRQAIELLDGVLSSVATEEPSDEEKAIIVDEPLVEVVKPEQKAAMQPGDSIKDIRRRLEMLTMDLDL